MGIRSFLLRLRNFILDKRKELYLGNLVKNGMKLGTNVQIVDTFFFDPSHCYLITIMDNCIICPGVRLIAHDASTKNILGYTKLGKIEIRANCFIGDSTIILPGVTIGPNAIVGAASVVAKNIPPYTVSAGNPAKTICTLDDYIKKVTASASGKKIFDHDYDIEYLDGNKREAILNSVGKGIGFII